MVSRRFSDIPGDVGETSANNRGEFRLEVGKMSPVSIGGISVGGRENVSYKLQGWKNCSNFYILTHDEERQILT